MEKVVKHSIGTPGEMRQFEMHPFNLSRKTGYTHSKPYYNIVTPELKDTGDTETALQPGVTDTDFFHKAEAADSIKVAAALQVAAATFKTIKKHIAN